jgi:hypothetical protein
MRRDPMPPPPGWKMGVRGRARPVPRHEAEEGTEYTTLCVDTIVDLEDWRVSWVPTVPPGGPPVSLPMEDEDEVDPTVRELASFVTSLVTSGKRVLVYRTEGLNRSGAVVARALKEMGLSPTEAIDWFADGGVRASTGSRPSGTQRSSSGCSRRWRSTGSGLRRLAASARPTSIIGGCRPNPVSTRPR